MAGHGLPSSSLLSSYSQRHGLVLPVLWPHTTSVMAGHGRPLTIVVLPASRQVVACHPHPCHPRTPSVMALSSQYHGRSCHTILVSIILVLPAPRPHPLSATAGRGLPSSSLTSSSFQRHSRSWPAIFVPIILLLPVSWQVVAYHPRPYHSRTPRATASFS